MKRCNLVIILTVCCVMFTATPIFAAEITSIKEDMRNLAASHSGSLLLTAATPSNGGGNEDMISIIEKEAVDENGNVTIIVTVEDAVRLPLSLTLKGADGLISFTVVRNGQPIKIRAGNYKLTRAVDADEKKLPSGAYLTIAEDGGPVYLSFQPPENGESSPIFDFLRTNLIVIPSLAGIMYVYFHKRKKN